MLLANETVATHLEEHDVPALHRVHEAPDVMKVADFEEFITTLRLQPRGAPVSASARGTSSSSSSGCGARRRSARSRCSMLRTMQKARYDAANLGHFGLAARALHALHVADPALSRSRRAPHAARVRQRRADDGAARGARRGAAGDRRATPPRWSAGPTTPSASWCSGRRSASWPTRSATSSRATSPASRRSACSSNSSSTTSKGSSTSRAWPTTTTASSSSSTSLRGENTQKIVSARRQGAGAGGPRRHGAAPGRSGAGGYSRGGAKGRTRARPAPQQCRTKKS